MEAFIARQPIFDKDKNVFAYELLFRDSLDNVFTHQDSNQASSRVIADSFVLQGMEKLTGGKIAFINITQDILIKNYVTLLPKDFIAVEILETVEPDTQVIAACKKLKQSGYLMVLDDFVYEERFKPFVDLADIIKVDFLATKKEERRHLVEEFSPRGILFLAEKVETQEAFQEALDIGYHYFQGYFFSKPLIVSSRVIPGDKLHYLNLLREIQQPEIDFARIEEIIKRDISLSYKLLRYINSAFFGLRLKIKSLRHALTLLGKIEIRKWTSLVSLASMGNDKPEELLNQSIVRAKFCEALAFQIGLPRRSDDLFLMGMFSLIDAIVDHPLPEILKDIPIDDDIKAALLGEQNILREVFECVLSYETGDWNKLSQQATKLGIDETVIPNLYQEAVEWGHQSLQEGFLNE